MTDTAKSLIIAAAWLPAGCASSSEIRDEPATMPPTTVEAVGVVSAQIP